MILEFDVGNSRLKWRVVGGDGTILGRGSQAMTVDLRTMALFNDASVVPERVRVANVGGKETGSLIREICQSSWGIAAEFALPARCCAGVTNAYEDPRALGIDRWLAILAAYNDCLGTCCVVDAGSAATFDAIANGGQHLGGYIVPGLSLQKRSLLEGTGIRMPESDVWSASVSLGKTTQLAVSGGILTMLVDWVHHEYKALAADGETTLYLCGGDAAVLSESLDRRGIVHRLVPDLVLDGLAIALP